MCNVENCNNLDEFCILTKHDFPCKHRMKDAIFGQTFENHDSNDIIRHCFNAITLGQTFMDDFGLIQGSNAIDRDHSPSIPVGNWQTDLYRKLSVLPPCDMVNMQLMMISFIHKLIMGKPSVLQYLNEENENVQDFMGNYVFFS